MHVMTVEAAFTDERGAITDLFHLDDTAVTIVASEAGAVRGNHYHERTAQWAHVMSGRMQVVSSGRVGVNGQRLVQEAEVTAGQTVFNPAGEWHAWRALEDTVCVVITQGPRAGKDYERDTTRLVGDERLIS
jgi:quercetin dioxygenase-like cupin family protein